MPKTPHEELLASVVSEIRSYKGDDPLRPWVRGIRRMRQLLPANVLAEKLPRFLQKCVESFESDCRYRDDIRYLQVWILMMDHVDDPRSVLRRMEKNRIGIKHSAFYVAYAWYYEKNKKFEKAEKMYHLGVRNLAEPAAELQKSYEQFLQNVKVYNKRISKLKKARENATTKVLPDHHRDLNIHEDENSEGNGKAKAQLQNGNQIIEMKGTCETSTSDGENRKMSGRMSMTEPQLDFAKECCESTDQSTAASRGETILNRGLSSVHNEGKVAVNAGLTDSCVSISNLKMTTDKTSFKNQGEADRDDTVVVKFVDSAIVGKSESEDACHHGLVDPTINMKEAINAINNMFREPLEPDPKLRRKSQCIRTKANMSSRNSFEVYTEENADEGLNFMKRKIESTHHNVATKPDEPELFKILADDEDDGHCTIQTALPTKYTDSENLEPSVGSFVILADDDDDDSGYAHIDDRETKKIEERSRAPSCDATALLGLSSRNLPSCSYDGSDFSGLEYAKTKEDTVICNFVGSTVSGEHEAEDACHHGLVDPTVNLKEALHDINNMFGKPIDFVKATRHRKRDHLLEKRQVHNFSIMVDEDVDLPAEPPPASRTDRSCGDYGLFEPTMFTREAMDEINKMFGNSLDF